MIVSRVVKRFWKTGDRRRGEMTLQQIVILEVFYSLAALS